MHKTIMTNNYSNYSIYFFIDYVKVCNVVPTYRYDRPATQKLPATWLSLISSICQRHVANIGGARGGGKEGRATSEV